MSARTAKSRLLSWPRSLLLIALGGLAIAGYFGPWTPHPAGGLVITGLDLAEYVKFLPEVMSGQIPVQREAFYAPLTAGSLIATLLASRPTTIRPVRILLLIAALALALAQLPPAWTPGTLKLPEFRIQVITIALCLAAVLLIVLIRYLPDRLILAVSGLLALAAALWPAWSFWQVRPAISAVYNAPLPLGWGFWACLSGYVGLAFIGAAFALERRKPARGQTP